MTYLMFFMPRGVKKANVFFTLKEFQRVFFNIFITKLLNCYEAT